MSSRSQEYSFRSPPSLRYWSSLALGIVLAVVMRPASGVSQAATEPAGGALTGERYRVMVSTDIGGSDPDDYQSMIHYLVYADLFDTEGLISSPPNAGRKAHVLEVIDAYEQDYPLLQRHSARYPQPADLRRITKQGAVDSAPPDGFSGSTEGSRWIVERANAADERPLYVLVWGSLTDVAQALHDAPGIAPRLRVYAIGSWNTRQDPAAREYIHTRHRDLWLIESDTTFRGMYMGGNQEGDLGNRQFVRQHVQGHGALGALFMARKPDIKMGDTPSVLYLLRGTPDDPTAESWGGSYVPTDHGPDYWTDNPDAALAEGQRPGAKTVSRWRESFLRDWQRRMDRLQ